MTFQELKALASMPSLVAETHQINQGGKISCPNPSHKDSTPSCHVFESHLHCFGCGWRADQIDWLKLVLNTDTAGAIKALKQRAGITSTVRAGPASTRKLSAPPPETVQGEPWTAKQTAELARLAAQAQENWADRGPQYLPKALQNRGFNQADLKTLGIVEIDGVAGLPILRPDGRVLALKMRGQTYWYYRGRKTTPSRVPSTPYLPWPNGSDEVIPQPHNPAWCNPGFSNGERLPLLVMEGELNAAVTWLALRDRIDVMGVASASGRLYTEHLQGRVVFVYADADDPGRKAVNAWSKTAVTAGAARVLELTPLPSELDACDLAHHSGKDAVTSWLSTTVQEAANG